MPIRRLPPLLVNQIAAGEVIERPASVVKECVENSIDAGARRIEITIEDGGRELVRVSDDGCGIAPEELALAVAPHATSKISGPDDLDAIATMGFRGEALASIASVSRLSIVSRPEESEEARLIEAEGADVRAPRPIGGPVGTTVTVRNLFFNTPARRKFLRTEQTEASRVAQVVEALALAHPAIGFVLKVDGRKTLDLVPAESARERVLAVLGEDLEPELLELNVRAHGMRVWGMAGRPSIARGTSKHQRVFVNGRSISDKSIAHAIKESYRGLIEPTRYPTIVLFIEMEPALVDVNVHPAKAEVRFRNQNAVHGTVLNGIREALRNADLTPNLALGPGRVALPPLPQPEFGAESSTERSTGEFIDYIRNLNPRQKGFVYSEVKQALAREAPELLDEHERAPAESTGDVLEMSQAVRMTDALQVHSSFIVTQDRDGLLIIDQHALHERVIFEQLRSRIASGSIESQRLLMPAVIEVDPSHLEQLDHLRPLLERIGIEAEPIGPRSVAIHAYSSLLFERGVEPSEFMADLLDRAVNEGLHDDPEAALHEVLDMMACKAAVKAGDRLTPDELNRLLEHRESVERASNCPHGRPTSLRLSLRDLERQFGRR